MSTASRMEAGGHRDSLTSEQDSGILDVEVEEEDEVRKTQANMTENTCSIKLKKQ